MAATKIQNAAAPQLPERRQRRADPRFMIEKLVFRNEQLPGMGLEISCPFLRLAVVKYLLVP